MLRIHKCYILLAIYEDTIKMEKTENRTIRGSVSIQQTKTGKLIVRMSFRDYDVDWLCLQGGDQPKSLFDKIVINRRRR